MNMPIRKAPKRVKEGSEFMETSFNQGLMCQHFSGHIIKQLYAAFQILPATGSHC